MIASYHCIHIWRCFKHQHAHTSCNLSGWIEIYSNTFISQFDLGENARNLCTNVPQKLKYVRFQCFSKFHKDFVMSVPFCVMSVPFCVMSIPQIGSYFTKHNINIALYISLKMFISDQVLSEVVSIAVSCLSSDCYENYCQLLCEQYDLGTLLCSRHHACNFGPEIT